MIEKLKIGDISLLFQYQFNDFFRDELQKYRVDYLLKDHYLLEVEVQDEIQDIESEHKFVFENKCRVQKNGINYIISYYPNQTIRHMMSYTDDYKKIKIILNRVIGNKLPENEYILSGMMFFEIAISKNYLAIHASALAINGKAILLSGPSKSGKSTQTNFLRKQFPQSIIVNEDKPLIFEKDNSLYVCGSPWSGKNVLNSNMEVELGNIFFVNKAEESKLVSISTHDKMKQMMKNIYRPRIETHIDNTIVLLEKVILQIEMLQFNCVNNETSSVFLKQYLEGNL